MYIVKIYDSFSSRRT